MKFRPQSSQVNREIAGNVSGGMDLLLGTKNSPIAINIFVTYLVGSMSIGSKIFIRKKLGVRAVNPLMLILHSVAIWLFLSIEFESTNMYSFAAFYQQFPLVSYYLIILFTLGFIHFINISVLNQGMGYHTYYRGYGPIHYFVKRDDETKNQYLRLIDPFIVALAASYFLFLDQGRPLAWILWGSCAFLLFEEVMVFYRSWHAELDLRDAEEETKELSEKHEAYLRKQNGSNGKSEEITYRVQKKK